LSAETASEYAPVVEAEKLLRDAKEKGEKMPRPGLVSQGKLDEGIVLIDEVVKLDPKQTEASAWRQNGNQKNKTVMKHVESIKKLITAKRIVDAEKELPEAQNSTQICTGGLRSKTGEGARADVNKKAQEETLPVTSLRQGTF